ncbi:hypothetical protein [Companilactobacillus sp. FL22-1]|uniref:hypothetical protein n=1 Tax=Companilactobacillus sp. FL22-1 TaxID=3373892 RepID=UPI0037549649
MDRIAFGRKINNVPMIVSLAIGLIIGIVVFIFTKLMLLAVILGAAAVVIVASLYARSMVDYYGYWDINEEEIRSFNYQNYSVRLQSVLFPFSESQESFKLTDIKSATVVVGQEMNAPANILGGSFNAPTKIMFHLPTPYYLDVSLQDGREAYLDLSADWDDSETIEYVINLISSEAEINVDMVKQAN